MNDTGLMEFIEVLKENRCLWDPKDLTYTNRAMRKAARLALLNIYQKYDANANLASVRRKIDNIRATYLRERKKLQASETGGSSNETGVPTLWYYDHLNFLSEVYKVPKTGADSPDPLIQSFLDDDEEERHEVHPQSVDDTTDFQSPQPKALKRKRISAQKQLIAATERLNNMPVTGVMDCWDAFGMSVGGDLRNLDNKQQTIAQKLISDVIFFAKMGQLSEGSTVDDTSIRLMLSSPSASSITCPFPPACNASGSLTPYQDVAATKPPPVSDSSKYSFQKINESKYYFPNKQLTSDDPSVITTQQESKHTSLPQHLREFIEDT